MGVNYFISKKVKEGWISLVIGLGAAVAYLYETSVRLDWIPAPFHLIAASLLMYIVAEKLQGSMFEAYLAAGGKCGSNVAVLVLSVGVWVVLFFAFLY
ncbi:hypothetical protein HUS23_14260 [Ectothiorhodospiraceae bacterium 2226]|nr:hypothetical protein HUS23_14260 [Ectothiorhodospiraceae bacterium 2226]